MTILAFKCKMCGHCCLGEGGIILTSKDQIRLAEHLGISVDELIKKYTHVRNDRKDAVSIRAGRTFVEPGLFFEAIWSMK